MLSQPTWPMSELAGSGSLLPQPALGRIQWPLAMTAINEEVVLQFADETIEHFCTTCSKSTTACRQVQDYWTGEIITGVTLIGKYPAPLAILPIFKHIRS